MGWFGKKAQVDTPEASRTSTDLSVQTLEGKKDCCAEKPLAIQQEVTLQESAAATGTPYHPAIFEFGGPAVTGLAMKGICEVDDPDQIQACVWHVDKIPADQAKATPMYQIAF